MTVGHLDDLLTLAEAARLLKVSRATLHRWIRQGRLPAFHVGPRAVRVRQADVAKLVRPNAEAEESHLLSADGGPQLFPLPTAEQVQRALAAMERARAMGKRILAERGGVPLEESWPLIRESRDERASRI